MILYLGALSQEFMYISSVDFIFSIKCGVEKCSKKRDARANQNLLLFAVPVAVAVIVAKKRLRRAVPTNGPSLID